MSRILFATTVACFFVFSAAFSWAGGLMSYDECSRNCQQEYKGCKQKETAESVINDVSCAELLEMCELGCRNRQEYIECKRNCGNDPDCLDKCKERFMRNVPDYRPYLQHKNKD
ncbi:hypothetical protein SAMN02746041_00337 [Desulfacinum hydrothermale DSM 13146]|uniref:Uncharacterized protein n=1 Tax=Desulfacinum hydrothermale DSM 13146 TaxID=1121390 RepID=A0A1W1X198_9BACT|nr:hypothetical protein [Desulfacinum hydrothermale]SMC17540.1 hypothetical protein SAMN02746041_00337 [Desulfacinum hydrothermale DSM 13146]